MLAAATREMVRRRGRGVFHSLWTGAGLAPLGRATYVLRVGRRAGDPLGGSFAVQRRWGSRFDAGRGPCASSATRCRTAKARPWHAAVVAGALAGLSFAYGAYLAVIARTPLWSGRTTPRPPRARRRR
ncbi:hypothetical protein [Streptomyces sp. NPDC014006]|uniref:hypothetical protein n=1 Tax=Streptomyces sp. NPDC014006 TaxID=3364870 RepID=UPI003702D8CE